MAKRLNPLEFLNRTGVFDLDDIESIATQVQNSRPRRASKSVSQRQYGEAEWADGLDFLIENADFQTRKKAQNLKTQFNGVDTDGFVHGKCADNGKTYSLAIKCDPSSATVIGSCSCAKGRHEAKCSHLVAFASYLDDEMSDVDSSLRARIINEMNLIPDPSLSGSLAISVLDEFIRNIPQKETIEETNEDPTRIVWRIDTSDYVDIEPIIQKKKKRGNGWTKGKKIRPETLRDSDRYPLSPIDVKVLRAWERTYGYYGGYEWNIVQALTSLAGHDAVEWNGQPANVYMTPFRVALEQRKSGYFLYMDMPGKEMTLCEDGIVSTDTAKQCIYVCECTEAERNFAHTTLADKLFVPENRVEEVRKRIDRLTQSTTVRLPEKFGGPIAPAKSVPVLKLLSRKDGQLQCGLRVRTNEHLNRPGEGILIYSGTENGKPVQLQRDALAEQEMCQAIIPHIGLANAFRSNKWDWRFTEFDDSLAFLEIIETKSTELEIEVLWDEESVQALNIVGSITAKNVQVELKRKKDWFGIEGGFTLGEHKFSLPELLAAVDSEPAQGYAELRPGMWAKITERLRKRLRELRDATHQNRSKLEIDVTAVPIIQSLQDAELDIKASKEWEECVHRLDDAKKLRPAPSKKLKAELRDYQREGYCWMRRLAEWGVGGCLADDMGLGKTVQALAVLLDRVKTGPALVIAPTSVGFNWQRETEKFTTSLKPHLYRETDRADFLRTVKNGDLVICSYGLALRDAEALADVPWGTLILDEAQFIKNSRSKTALAIRSIPAGWKLALTGTPMENHLGELWSLFRTISPGIFGSWEQFRKRFAAPIEKDNDPERRKALSKLIQPFILRRTKSEVLKDLPERTEINLQVDLSDAERQRYDEMRLAAIGELDEIAGLPETNDQRFRVLAILTRLRQMACHIGLVDENWEGESAKLALLVEKVTELKDEGHRVLIFSQFTKYLALIRKVLDENGVTYEYLDGKTTPKARQERVDRFQEGDADAFLISLKAGGTGLNLTAADYVIHMDPWWNPAVEDQATDRSHRIGQTKPVIVYRIVANGTVEDQILSLHADKRDLVAGVMEGTQKAAKMSTDQLLEVIRG